jgi:hypothetical protein
MNSCFLNAFPTNYYVLSHTEENMSMAFDKVAIIEDSSIDRIIYFREDICFR